MFCVVFSRQFAVHYVTTSSSCQESVHCYLEWLLSLSGELFIMPRRDLVQFTCPVRRDVRQLLTTCCQRYPGVTQIRLSVRQTLLKRQTVVLHRETHTQTDRLGVRQTLLKRQIVILHDTHTHTCRDKWTCHHFNCSDTAPCLSQKGGKGEGVTGWNLTLFCFCHLDLRLMNLIQEHALKILKMYTHCKLQMNFLGI